MGAVYYVELLLKYDDEKKVVEKAHECMEKQIKEDRASFGRDFDDLDGMAETYLAAHQHDFVKYGEGDWSSGFDASYGWETVITGLFEHIAPYLKDGSLLYMEPDNSHYTLKVKDGKVQW